MGNLIWLIIFFSFYWFSCFKIWKWKINFENVINQTYSSKNGIVESNILGDFKGILLRLKKSRKVELNNKTPFRHKTITVFAVNLELINY